jgi:hypothetical protein
VLPPRAAAVIASFDGVLFFLLSEILLAGQLTFDYEQGAMLGVMTVYSLAVVVIRMLSRVPMFIRSEFTDMLKATVDLPFDGQSLFEGGWITVVLLLRLCYHLMSAAVYRRVLSRATKHDACRFVRERELRHRETGSGASRPETRSGDRRARGWRRV